MGSAIALAVPGSDRIWAKRLQDSDLIAYWFFQKTIVTCLMLFVKNDFCGI